MANSGPGKSFRKGLSLAALFRKFPDDAAAERWIADCRWGGEPACPHCGDTNVQTGAKHPSQPYRCRGCRKFFSVRTGTAMAGSNLGYQTWAVATYLLATRLKGQASMKLHRDLGISQKAAWFLAHRLREAWDDGKSPFAGPIEVDEAYIGGLEKNKHEKDKLRAGRGPVGKVPVVGVKDRASNQIAAKVIDRTDGATITEFVDGHADPDATVYTDGTSTYKGRKKHEKVRHSVGEYVRGQAHTNGLKSFWSLLKRGYGGTYRKISPKHLGWYVREFEGRRNQRNLDTIDHVRRMVRGNQGKRLTYKDLTAGGPAYP